MCHGNGISAGLRRPRLNAHRLLHALGLLHGLLRPQNRVVRAHALHCALDGGLCESRKRVVALHAAIDRKTYSHKPCRVGTVVLGRAHMRVHTTSTTSVLEYLLLQVLLRYQSNTVLARVTCMWSTCADFLSCSKERAASRAPLTSHGGHAPPAHARPHGSRQGGVGAHFPPSNEPLRPHLSRCLRRRIQGRPSGCNDASQ